MQEEPSADLLARWREGDQQAASKLAERYLERLLALARSRMSAKLTRRLDPEDVVQSACRSFFVRARKGEYILARSGDLWRLLVGITLHKLFKQIERHTAQKRGLAQEREASVFDLPVEALAREPSPEEAAALADEVEQVMRRLEAKERLVLELRLQGHQLEEIAGQVKCSERNVRRVLEKVRRLLEEVRKKQEEA